MILTLPNLLTLGRLFAAPGVALAFALLPRPSADFVGLGLFVAAAMTDWLDGWLARARGQISAFGTMLDPIADKAMIVIALATLCALTGPAPLVLVPAAVILLREVFVSGLREYLGAAAGKLAVTRWAKWKTAVQMAAIAVLLARGIPEHYLGMLSFGMDAALFEAVMRGDEDDVFGLRRLSLLWHVTTFGGLGLLWVAAALTLATGWDYLRKALPLLEPRT